MAFEVEDVVVTESDGGTTAVFSWDGRVLEVFHWVARGPLRFHVANLDLAVEGPDKKGRHQVQVGFAVRAGERRFQRGSWSWMFDEDAMVSLRPLLDAVDKVRAS